MKILFISNDLIAGDLPVKLKEEGHNVKLYIEAKEAKKDLDNLVPKITNWRNELKWVGKTGLIIFDDVGYGEVQDMLRQEGYTVFGGSALGEKLETDREFGQKIMSDCGIKHAVSLKNFFDIRSGIDHIKQNPATWVVKQNNHAFKNLTYVGEFEDGKDVIDVLESYEKNANLNCQTITLQKKLYGIEMGVGRYFNGNDWVGPIEINLEHTRFFPGDLGPTTNEMGTLAWYTDDESDRLFNETLSLLKPFLQKVNFRGDIAINCIINDDGAFPLEITARLGTPIIHLQEELHSSDWGDFLYAVASGKKHNLKWKRGFGIVVLMVVPPFPSNYKSTVNHYFFGTNIYFDKTFNEKDMEHTHFEEIARRYKNEDQLYISDTRGYILYTTGHGKTVEEARDKAYSILKKIKVPKSFYRNDIGIKFMHYDQTKLEKLGYVKSIKSRINTSLYS